VPVDVGPYFMVPKAFFQSGRAARVGPSGIAIYTKLCEHANRKGQNTFRVSDKALADEAGVAERTIRDIRTKLEAEGLITRQREAGQSYTYTILRLPSEWVPTEDRPRKKRKQRAIHATRSALVEAGKSQAALANLAGPSGKLC
jgi:hypothetical protein